MVISAGPLYADENISDTSRSEQDVSKEVTEKGLMQNITIDSFGALDAEKYMAEALRMSVPDSTAAGKDIRIESDSREAKMFNALLANNWVITRTVVFGMDGLDRAALNLSKGTHVAQKFDWDNQTKIQAASGTGKTSAATYTGDIDPKYDQIVTSAEKQALERNKAIADDLLKIAAMPGIAKGNSIYDRVSLVAIFMLSFTLLLRLAGTTWSLFLGTNKQHESPGILYMQCFGKFIVFLAYILLLKYGVAALMMLSEIVRNVIIQATSATGASGNGDLAEQLQTLITTRNILAAGEDEPILISDSGVIPKMAGLFASIFTEGIGNTIGQLIAWCLSRIFFWLTSVFITVMVILGDVMLAISAAIGPLVFAVAMIKGFEGWMDNYIRSIITFSLYMPIAGIYAVTMCIIYALVPDMGFLAYVTISWAFLLGAMKIPNLAEALSGTALATMATAFIGKLVSAAMMAARLPMGKLIGK